MLRERERDRQTQRETETNRETKRETKKLEEGWVEAGREGKRQKGSGYLCV